MPGHSQHSGHSQPFRLGWVKDVCVFRCNLPPALLAEWPGSFTCHCGNVGWNGHRMSQHRKLTLEKKILPLLLPGLKVTTFRSWVWCSTNTLSWLPSTGCEPTLMQWKCRTTDSNDNTNFQSSLRYLYIAVPRWNIFWTDCLARFWFFFLWGEIKNFEKTQNLEDKEKKCSVNLKKMWPPEEKQAKHAGYFEEYRHTIPKLYSTKVLPLSVGVAPLCCGSVAALRLLFAAAQP